MKSKTAESKATEGAINEVIPEELKDPMSG
jgi:hypothetical protein